MDKIASAKKTINNFIAKEKSERKNLGTFTAVHFNPTLLKYLPSYLNKNLVDKKSYSSLKRLEKVIDDFMKLLYHHEKGATIVTSGSSEAILVALYQARERGREKGILKPNIVIGENAHYSFTKCAKFLGLEVKIAKLSDDFSIDVNDVRDKVNKETVLIVGTMGSTELGTVDDLSYLDAVASESSVPLHVDAAIGGFVIPFLKSSFPYQFSTLESLCSVNVSGHKYGLSLPGCGLLLIKDKKTLTRYSDPINYLSSGRAEIGVLTVTASTLGLLSLAVNIITYGAEGYRQFAESYLRTRDQFVEGLSSLEIDYFVGYPLIPQVFIYPHDVSSLSRYLKKKGWIQSIHRATGLDKFGLRVVIKKDQESLVVNDLMKDIEEFLAETDVSRTETTSFSQVI